MSLAVKGLGSSMSAREKNNGFGIDDKGWSPGSSVYRLHGYG